MTTELIISKTNLNINSIIIQYLPLVIVIIAGIFAIIQVRLNQNANYRLKWIEGFRNAVSILISEINDYSDTVTKIIIDGRKKEENTSMKDADIIRFQNAIKSSTKYLSEVLLFLDPKNKRHQEIIKSLDDIELACKNSSLRIEDFADSIRKHFETLISLAQIEISDQWRKSQKWIN